MKFRIEYYRDVWRDDEITRTANHTTKPGQVISLPGLIDHFAYDSCSYAVLYVDGNRDSNWKRDTETRKFREDTETTIHACDHSFGVAWGI